MFLLSHSMELSKRKSNVLHSVKETNEKKDVNEEEEEERQKDAKCQKNIHKIRTNCIASFIQHLPHGQSQVI